MAIVFAYGSQSQYDKLKAAGNVDESAVYFINDSQRIYRGEEVIAQCAINFVTEVPETLASDTLYVKTTVDETTGAKTLEILSSDGETVTTVASSETADPEKLVEVLPKLTSEDVEAGKLSEATDEQLATAGALKTALEWVKLED